MRTSTLRLGTLVLSVVLYYLCAAWAQRSRAALRTAVAAYLVAGLALTIVAALSISLDRKFDWLPAFVAGSGRLIRLPGAEGGVSGNEVGGVLLWIIPLLVVLTGHLLRARAAWFALLPLLAAQAITWPVFLAAQSRSAWAGLAVGLAVMLTLWSRRARLWLPLPAALAVIVLISTQQLRGDTVLSRVEIWGRALMIVRDFPLTGFGAGNFGAAIDLLYPVFTRDAEAALPHAHNIWLQVATDYGLPALAAYVAIWINAGAMLADVLRRSTAPLPRAVALAVIGSLTSYAVYGATDAVALGARPTFFFFILLALATAAWRVARAHEEPAR